MEDFDGDGLTSAQDDEMLNFHVDDDAIPDVDDEAHEIQVKAADYERSPPVRFVAQAATVRLSLTSMFLSFITWSCQLGLSTAPFGTQQQTSPSKLNKHNFLYLHIPSPLGSQVLHLEHCTQAHVHSPHQPQLSERVLLT